MPTPIGYIDIAAANLYLFDLDLAIQFVREITPEELLREPELPGRDPNQAPRLYHLMETGGEQVVDEEPKRVRFRDVNIIEWAADRWMLRLYPHGEAVSAPCTELLLPPLYQPKHFGEAVGQLIEAYRAGRTWQEQHQVSVVARN